jgi:serine/threonine protein kinase
MSQKSSLINTKLGRYTLIERIGSGGMATVFRAEDSNLKRMVAVKVLHEHLTFEGNLRERFEQEAHIIASFNHPNIVQVYDFDVIERDDSQLYYMVMPLISGQSLNDLLESYRAKEQLLPLEQVKRIMLDLTSALSYAHERGMVHRDVKPSNILFDQDGRAILTDFGIARLVKRGNMTQEGVIIGTPAYMSPEQAMGGVIDHRSDLYALGVIFFELLSGRVPFEDENTVSVIFKHIQEPIPPISAIMGETFVRFEAVIAKALGKHPENRYQTAQAFADDIKALFSDTSTAEFVPTSAGTTTPKTTIALATPPPSGMTQANRTTILKTLDAIVLQPAKQNPLAFVALLVAMATLLLVARFVQTQPTAPITDRTITSIGDAGATTVEGMTGSGVESMTGESVFFTSTFEADDMTRAYWMETPDGSLRRTFTEDGDYLIVNEQAGTASSTLLNMAHMYRNVTISMEGVLEDESAPNSAYGIIFNYQDDDNYNVFAVDGMGRYSLWVRQEGTWQELRRDNENWSLSEAVRPKGEPNMLTIRTYFGTFQGIINDMVVVEVTDMTFREGRIGIYVATPRQGVASVRVNRYMTQRATSIIPSMTVGS